MAVNLTLAKQHLRVDSADEETLITTYLSAAKAWVENYTGLRLTRGAVQQVETAFGSYISLNYGPSPANVSIAYTDDVGAPQEITDARIVRDRLYSPAAGWPSAASDTPVIITYTAGFTETPADLDAAVLLLVGHWYAHREAVNIGNITAEVPMGVEALCSPYRAVLV